MIEFLDEESVVYERDIVEDEVKGPLSPVGLYQLFLFSTLHFVLAAIIVQFLMNLQNVIILKMYYFNLLYTPLGVKFLYSDVSKWTIPKIFEVYGLIPLAFFVIGILMVWILRKRKLGYWKLRLLLTWMAFIFVHTLPVGLIAGTLIFDGFGIAHQWLIQDITIRIGAALAIIAVVRMYRSLWQTLFLKAAYAGVFVSDYTNRRTYLRNAFVRPWYIGCLLLFPFAWKAHSIYWLAFLLGLGIVVMPLSSLSVPSINLAVAKSKVKFWTFRYPFDFLIMLLLALWWLCNTSIVL